METEFDIPKLKKGYKLDLPDTSVYYFDIDHPRSHGPNFLTVFNNFLVENNWFKFISPGSTAIDIGGHTGDTAIVMQYLARGTVLAVEPVPGNLACQDFNCLVNSHLGKFISTGEAVTDQNVDRLEILDHNNGMLNGGVIDPSWSPELQAHMRASSSNSIVVEGVTLETLCQRHLTAEEINNISFIKTDTEGHDISILIGSKEFIDRIRPVIFIEWFGGFTTKENIDMFQSISDLGYQAFDPRTLESAQIDSVIPDLLLIHSDRIGEYL